jgi:hypothetical protein
MGDLIKIEDLGQGLRLRSRIGLGNRIKEKNQDRD